MSQKVELISKLEEFYKRVNLTSQHLEKIHSKRLKCRRGCAACCIDEITVFEIEAENIRFKHAELLRNSKPYPKGKCAFLDENDLSCRIYENRPYICRTQGLPFRWFDEENLIEYRDICPLNETNEPLENIKADECLTIGFFESWLASLQAEFGNGQMTRISLRKLFENER